MNKYFLEASSQFWEDGQPDDFIIAQKIYFPVTCSDLSSNDRAIECGIEKRMADLIRKFKKIEEESKMKLLVFTAVFFTLTTFGGTASRSEHGANFDWFDGPYKYVYATCDCTPNEGEKKQKYLFIGVVQTRSAIRIKSSFSRQIKSDYTGWASIVDDMVVNGENSFQKAKENRLGTVAKHKKENYKIEYVKLTKGRDSTD